MIYKLSFGFFSNNTKTTTQSTGRIRHVILVGRKAMGLIVVLNGKEKRARRKKQTTSHQQAASAAQRVAATRIRKYRN